MLLERFLGISVGWQRVFAQSRSHNRAVWQAIGSLCCIGRHTLTEVICALGGAQADWSADYRLHSRSKWQVKELYTPILERAHRLCGRGYVAVAFDDTRLPKSGRRVPGVTYWADPLGPKFRVQLMWGLRFLQASLLVPEYRRGGCAARGLPVAFTEVPSVKRPGRWASVADRIAYKKAASQHNLSTAYQRELATIREQLDRTGAYSKVLIAVVDGSFCNRACMRTEVERTTLVARARKDARLCFPADDALQPRRIYGAEKFTPEQVRQDDRRPWKQARVFHGKRYRSIRYKEVGPVLWQRATGPKPLRLIVIAPTRYRPRTKAARAKSKYYYHESGYLLCTDQSIPASVLIQKYFDRWQIEVNHKEEKDTLGIGQAQLRSPLSVPRQPALCVAAYSTLMLASMLNDGPKRTDAYPNLPKWYKGALRPTAKDLVGRLRDELIQMSAQTTGPFHLAQLTTSITNDRRADRNVQT